MAEILITRGADLEAKNMFGETPLHVAAINGHIDVVEVLLDKGADLNAKNLLGNTPLHLAASRSQKDMAEILITRGADLEAKNRFVKTPLHLAASRSQKDMAEILLKNGADLEAKDINGNTPLHIAAFYSHIDVVKVLLKNRVDIEAQNNNRRTPLHLIVASPFCDSKSSTEILSLILNNYRPSLRRKEARIRQINPASPPIPYTAIAIREYINQQDNKGRSPLHGFVNKKHSSTVEILLENGASLIPNKKGKTPLDIALKKDHKEILEKFSTHTKYLCQADENRNTPVQDAYKGRKNQAMEFFIQIEGRSPGTLFDTDRRLCLQYAIETRRKDLQYILNNTTEELVQKRPARPLRQS